MIPKIKKIYKKNSKIVKICLLVLLILIVIIFVYKSLFYSNRESDIYGVRLRDIKENEFTKSMISDVKEKTASIDGVTSAKIKVKGRLIKFFVTFDSSVSNDDIKNKFNETLGYISDKVKGYYDITFYAIKKTDNEKTYPVIGYKHKNNTEINFEVF